MSAERPVLNKEFGESFVQLASSSRDHFGAFVEVWVDSAFQTARDFLPSEDFAYYQDVFSRSVEKRLSQNPKFGKALEEVDSAFAALSEDYTGDGSDLVGMLRQDWRMRVWELAVWVENFPPYQQAFRALKKIREIDRSHAIEYGSDHRPDRPCLERDMVIREVVSSGMARHANTFQRKFDEAVEATGAKDPYKDQFVIEAIEKIVDPAKLEANLAPSI